MTSPCARAGRIGVALLAASVLGGATAHAGADPLDCDATVHDPDGLLNQSRLDATIASTETLLGAEVHIRVEGTLDGGLDRRIEQLVAQCSGWQDTDTDELADDMLVVLFSAVERENSIYYGADLGPVLENRWDAATDAMIPDLRTGDYTDAVLEGLDGLSHDPLGSSASNDDTSDEDDRDEGVPGAVIFWVVVLVGIIAFSAYARQQGWTSGGGGGWDDDDDGSSGWTSGTRRRSRGFGSFGSRSRSSSRSSGGGSRRSGGGTKKW